MEVTPTTPIPRDEVKLRDSTKPAPPTVTYDGHKHHVGQAHGRVIPLIGMYRPYLLDVSTDKLAPGHMRVYADSVDDAVGVIVGGDAPLVIAKLAQARAEVPTSPVGEEPMDEETLMLLGGQAPIPEELSNDEKLQYAKYLGAVEVVRDLEVQLIGLLAGHADGARCVAQRAINTAAKADGRWDQLTDDERAELESAADEGPDGTYPTGILEEVPYVRFDHDGMDPDIVERGVWSADVPLVCNRGNYFPWNETLPPESFVVDHDDNGDEYLVPGDPNLVWIDVDSTDSYLDALHAAKVVDVTVRPIDQPADFLRPFVVEHRDRTLRELREYAAENESPTPSS